MTTKNDVGKVTLVAAAAIGNAIRVKLSSGQAAIAGAGEESIGVTEQSVASGGVVVVKLDNASGTQIVTASGTITVDADVYQAAAGDVSATLSGNRIGVALEATTDALTFEMLPMGVTS